MECDDCGQLVRMPPIEDPVAFVISLNMTRRHLDTSQRAMAANKIANLPAHRPASGTTAIAVVTQDHAAKLMNVSVDALQRARVVEQHGAPELVREVERGNISVSAAATVAKSRRR